MIQHIDTTCTVIFLPPGDVAAQRIHAGLQESLICIVDKILDPRQNLVHQN